MLARQNGGGSLSKLNMNDTVFRFSKLPYNVSQEEALKYSEVTSRLEVALSQLKNIVVMFLDKITSSTEILPFCITYMARVLHRSLTSKFPHTPEKDILKVSSIDLLLPLIFNEF